MMTSDELYGQLRKDHFIFAGPCALESFELALDTAHAVAEASKEAGLFAVFKSSWDKATGPQGKVSAVRAWSKAWSGWLGLKRKRDCPL